jgi:hypothetical protein
MIGIAMAGWKTPADGAAITELLFGWYASSGSRSNAWICDNGVTLVAAEDGLA